jgi:DNA polymerase-3 subunit chi
MTRIDFYIIGQNTDASRQIVACRLAEKAYKLGHRVYIHTESQAQSAQMDDLLWTFRAGSFLPHSVHPPEEDRDIPVLVGHDSPPEQDTDVLVNLAPHVPTFFSRFRRVAELVDQDAASKQSARERFRFYRERGYELQTHEL